MMRSRRALVLAGLGLASLLVGRAASAEVEADSRYSKAQTYSAALRYLRVDLGYEVTEKDPDSAYLLFRYLPPGQPKEGCTGAVEIVDAGDHVRVFVRIPRMPEYHAVVLRDGLMHKLRDEYGPPAPRTPPPKPRGDKPAGDKGAADKGAGDDKGSDDGT